MTAQERLAALKERVDRAKERHIKAEARLAELQRRETEVIGKVRARGFDPDNLTQEREIRERRLNELLEQAEQILDGAPLPPATPARASDNHDVPW